MVANSWPSSPFVPTGLPFPAVSRRAFGRRSFLSLGKLLAQNTTSLPRPIGTSAARSSRAALQRWSVGTSLALALCCAVAPPCAHSAAPDYNGVRPYSPRQDRLRPPDLLQQRRPMWPDTLPEPVRVIITNTRELLGLNTVIKAAQEKKTDGGEEVDRLISRILVRPSLDPEATAQQRAVVEQLWHNAEARPWLTRVVEAGQRLRDAEDTPARARAAIHFVETVASLPESVDAEALVGLKGWADKAVADAGIQRTKQFLDEVYDPRALARLYRYRGTLADNRDGDAETHALRSIATRRDFLELLVQMEGAAEALGASLKGFAKPEITGTPEFKGKLSAYREEAAKGFFQFTEFGVFGWQKEHNGLLQEIVEFMVLWLEEAIAAHMPIVEAGDLPEQLLALEALSRLPEVWLDQGGSATMPQPAAHFDIQGGHNVVQLAKAGEPSVPNDFHSADDRRVHGITGQNTGGKGIFQSMAQLIAWLAHTPAPVPADQAHVPLLPGGIWTVAKVTEDQAQSLSAASAGVKAAREVWGAMTLLPGRAFLTIDEPGANTGATPGAAFAAQLGKMAARTELIDYVFSTHHEPAAQAALNGEFLGRQDQSVGYAWHAEVRDGRATFKILPGGVGDSGFDVVLRQHGFDDDGSQQLVNAKIAAGDGTPAEPLAAAAD